jgi:diguanylate cyclase (GGDEF)-like protein
MPAAPLPPDEADRLRRLRSLDLLDTEAEAAFDDLVLAVAALMDTPVAVVSLVDEARQWFKAKTGWGVCGTDRDAAFCAYAILDPTPLVVPDATLDPRFCDNPQVTGEVGLRFYCGAPIIVGGFALGSLCAVDFRPREVSERQIEGLAALARQAATLIEARGDTERARQAEEKARENEAMVRAAAESSFDTFSILRPLRGDDGQVKDFEFVLVNEQAAKFLGATSAVDVVGMSLLKTLPASNGQQFCGIFANVLETGEPFEIEYVSQMSAMLGRWVRMKVSRSGDRIAVTGQDIHERRQATEELRFAQARLAATFDAVQVGIMVVSPDGIVLRANPEAERTLGLEAGTTQFVGSRLEFETLALDGSPLPTFDRPVAGALTGVSVRGQMMRLRWPDGREMCIHANAVPLWREGEEQPYAAVCSFLDVTTEVEQRQMLDQRFQEIAEANVALEAQRHQLQEANERLAALATTDGLTGLLNHRSLQELLDGAIAQAARSGQPLSLMLLDVDHFKRFNDDLGHQAGDAVLHGLASVLTHSCRESDIIARYGGEEFVVVMPGLSPEDAVEAAERLRFSIETAPWTDRGVTASIGVATLGGAQSKGDLIRAADGALYQSKHLGRNRVTFAAKEPWQLVA